MSDIVLAAIIGGFFGIISAFIAAYTASNKTANEMRIHQATTNVKIDNLTNEVQKHNNFAERIPVFEEQIRSINDRVHALEKKAG